MSKIISGKIHLDMQPIDPTEFVEAALESAQPLALAKRVTLTSSLDHAAGVICGDTSRLQQVMWNLLSNAIKFTPEGGIIRVVQQRHDTDLRLQVIDSGIGIAADFLPHVFDRFRQADASTARRYGGLGLGLAIVRQLVELHSGSIEVHSDGSGKGAIFTLHLPLLNDRSVKEPGGCKESPSLDATQDIEPTDLTGVRVLVIDDQPDAVVVTKWLLQTCSAEVLTAFNGLEGLALIEKWSPNVVISDIGMPDMDGIALIRRIRMAANKDVADVAAVGLSAFTRKEDHHRALQAVFDAYITKPINASALSATVAKLAQKTVTGLNKRLST